MADTVNKVTWIMELKDMLTRNLHQADEAAETLDHHMHGAKDTLKELTTVAIGLGSIYEGFEFIKGSLEEYEEQQKAVAQLNAGLASTNGAVGLTVEQLTEQADHFAERIPVAGDAIMDLQSQLLTFPAITGDTFEEATQAVLDMSARTHKGANELGVMLGKALQDPIKGINAMKRVGVNFSEEQKKIVTHLVETGHAAEAQKIILEELKTEYGGSAEAAGQTFAGQMAIMKESVKQGREALGELVAELITAMMPAIRLLISGFRNTITWIKSVVEYFKEHRAVTMALATALAVIITPLIAIRIWMQAVSLATRLWAAAQWLLNAAMAASPLTWFVIILAAVAAASVYCYMQFGTFRAVLWATWYVIKEIGSLIADVFIGMGKTIQGALTFDPSLVVAGAKQMISAVADAGSRIAGAAKKGYNEGLADFAKDQEADKKGTKNAPKTISKEGKPGAEGSEGAAAKAPKAEGQKNTVINIHIDKLVEKITNNVGGAAEAGAKMTEMVAQALLAAVRNAEINAAG